jgi:hypothetical protein
MGRHVAPAVVLVQLGLFLAGRTFGADDPRDADGQVIRPREELARLTAVEVVDAVLEGLLHAPSDTGDFERLIGEIASVPSFAEVTRTE